MPLKDTFQERQFQTPQVTPLNIYVLHLKPDGMEAVRELQHENPGQFPKIIPTTEGAPVQVLCTEAIARKLLKAEGVEKVINGITGKNLKALKPA